MTAYNCRLKLAHENGNRYIAEVCFEQIFDILLLQNVRNGIRLPTESALKRQMKDKMTALLMADNAYDEHLFKRLFSRCWRMSRGIRAATGEFSMDRRLLLGTGPLE